MVRCKVLVGGLLGLALTVGLAFAHIGGTHDRGPVYTVAQVRDRLAHDPGAWVGRTMLLRGVVVPCLTSGSPARVLYCRNRPQDLLNPGLAGASDPLPLVWGTQSPWRTVLRRLPLVSVVLPPPLTARWRAMATYRVQLRSAPAGTCTGQPCYEVLVLDATQ